MEAARPVDGGHADNACCSIPILTYHSIDDSGGVLSTPVKTFERHVTTLHDEGIRTVGLSDIAECLRARNGFPPRAIALTFDDGSASIYEHVFPLLCRYGFSATVFLVTDYCGRSNTWPGQPPWIDRLPLLRWPQILEMSRGGIHFGAHTKTHPDLRHISSTEMRAEVRDSKREIEDRLGQAVDSFAYPYGGLDARVLRVVSVLFAAACGTDLAFVRETSNPWCLERLDAYYLRPRLFPRYLNSPLPKAYLRMRRALRAIRHSDLLGDVARLLAGATGHTV
ncbi:MAG TPA: polysaccharide deacetylase family protein [Candidatus Acidoferrum sp.]|nr:polysaccharide deacetylase family protein [Candidatus Acidoferrum sp.]